MPLTHIVVAGFLVITGARPAADGGLAGTAWNAVELSGMPVAVDAVPADRRPHLVFGTDGRLSGADGCNRLTGPYTVKADGITFGQIAGTLMACPKTDEIVRRFRAALKGTSHWRIEKERLGFYGATGEPLAVFERRAATPAERAAFLVGTPWQLVRFEGGDGKVLTPDDPAKYTVEFTAGGQVAARVDCNRGRATWKVTSTGLELGALALTRAKCPDGSLHDQIAKQWTFVRSFVIRDGHLFLSLMADGGTYEFAPVGEKKQ